MPNLYGWDIVTYITYCLGEYWCLTRYPYQFTSSLQINFFSEIYLKILTSFTFWSAQISVQENSYKIRLILIFKRKFQYLIFIQIILKYSIYEIFGANLWLWALIFFRCHLNILDFWISISKTIFWFSLLVLCKIFLLTHFILSFLVRLIF